MDVQAGALNQRITIVRPAAGRSEAGYLCPASPPTVVRRCWAQFSRVSGTESLRAGADMSEVKVRFLVRCTATPIDRKMLVKYRGQDYEIEYVNDYGDAHRYMELVCRKLDTGGAP